MQIRLVPPEDALANAAKTPAVALQAAEDFATSTPSGTNSGGGGATTATTDLSPLLALAGMVFGEPVDDGKGNLTFDLNLRSCPKEEGCQRSLKLGLTVNTTPQISETVKAALPEDKRSDLAGKLAGSAGDDLTLAASWAYTGKIGGRRFGRDLEGYRSDLGALVDSAVGRRAILASVAAANEEIQAPLQDCRRVLEEKGAGSSISALDRRDMTIESFRELCPSQAESFEQVLLQHQSLIGTVQSGAEAALKTAGMDLFGKLLDNQPQLLVAASGRQRGDLFGSDELALSLTMEVGLINLNAALASGDYKSYVEKHRKGIDAGQRFAFSAQYANLEGGTVDLSALGLDPVENVDARRISVSAAYSRYYYVDERPVRVDLKAQYDDIDDNPSLQDRLVATLTFSIQAGEVEIPFGLVYANHAKYLGEVDEKVSAHIGLKFRSFGDKKKGTSG